MASPSSPAARSSQQQQSDPSTWALVAVRVPPGALGLIVSKSADPTRGQVIVDGFRPVGTNGECGVLQQHGQITRGSVLLGVNEFDFTDASKLSFDKIREILIQTSGLERVVRFRVPPAVVPVAVASIVAPDAEVNANITTTARFADVYEMGKELGSGTFSVVREATHHVTGEKFAIKCIKRDELSKDDLAALMLEVAILKQMQHPHIVKLFDVFQEDKYYYLVTEFMAGGELFDRIVEKNFYSEREARDLVKILLESIQYMHDADVVHRDLKPENLLLTSKDDVADIKLADFGFAKQVQMDDKGLATACGTPGYVAPEILQAKPYGKAVDIWSIGVITYILLCGYPPFHDDNQGVLFRKIKTGRFEFDSPYWDNVSSEAKDLILKMLVLNPNERWTAAQLLEHTWITGANVNTAQLTGALIELRKFTARRKFKAAVSTVKATISLTKKLTLMGLKDNSNSSNSTGSSDTTTTSSSSSALPAAPAVQNASSSSPTNGSSTAAPVPPAAPSILLEGKQRARTDTELIVCFPMPTFIHRFAHLTAMRTSKITKSYEVARVRKCLKPFRVDNQINKRGTQDTHKAIQAASTDMFKFFSRAKKPHASSDHTDGSPTDISDWDIVQVVVPPGPLGIMLDGSRASSVVLDAFEALPDGRKGVLELHGGITHGSVLAKVNEFDFLATKMTLMEAGHVLRETAHLERTLTFKVPPQCRASKTAKEEKATLLSGVTTSSALNVLSDVDSEEDAHTPSTRGSFTNTMLRKPSLTESGSTIVVSVKGSPLDPITAKKKNKFVTVDIPPGPLGLNLDGASLESAVVLGFIPLPDGSKGALELHGGVKAGSVLIEINDENVSKMSLDMVRARLGALAGSPRCLLFRLPPSASASKRASQASMLSRPRSIVTKVKVTVDEDLDLRRKLELALVMKFDKRKISRKECWFLIDAQWMTHWVAFVGQNGPLPGPITNEVLLQPEWRERLRGEFPGEPDTLRQGLERMIHYRCVNPMVWCILSELHGPGDSPVLVRYVLDINADPVDKESVQCILHDPQPTAAALVLELLSKCRRETVVED
ncbi:Camk protein kinase, partial [Globisporangium splendens]